MPARRRQGHQLLLQEARKQERECDWLAAVELYKKAATARRKRTESFLAAEISQRIGFCYHRASKQASNLSDFKKRMLQASQAYDEASQLCRKVKDSDETPKMLHCDARSAYISSWL
ncbi:MAG: hypothetical protein JSV58_01925, partial [Candidatus Bathyarchaeota archaeon]